MDGESEEEKKTAISKFTSGMTTAMLKLGEAMQDDNRLGLGRSEQLTPPITDSFGTFREKKVYQTGCDIGEVVEEGHVLWITTEDDKDIRNIEIGKTPPEYDPRKGGRQMVEAGTPDDYLLVSRKTNKQTGKSTQVSRYVNKSEITGAVVKKGEQVSLKPSPQGNRQIVLQGTVNSATLLR